MKIAIVHDYIKEYGGAERVLEELVKIFPESEIYTTVYLPKFLGPHKKRFKNYKIHTSPLQFVPFKGKFISYFRLIAPQIFKNMDLSDYDLVITSAAGTYTSPNFVTIGDKTKLICYCHTPPRYLYGYMTANNWNSNGFKKVLKLIGMIPMHFLRLWDFKAAQKPDKFIANSEEVKARIEKFYRRDAVVIFPPVEIPKYKLSEKENYYLAGGRLARAKGIDVIVKAFNKNGLPLKLFGKGFAGFDQELKEIAKKNIEFVGEVDDDLKFKLMAGAKAYIFASYDEDFGITPVESMGVGTPVIAFKSGGVKETIMDGVSGLFYEKNNPDDLNSAVKKFEKMKFDAKKVKKQAEKFSAKEFDRKIKEIVEG